MSISAEKPVLEDGRQYHLQTGPGDLAPDCLLVGSPERAEMVALKLMTNAKLVGDHRGYKSFTGKYYGHPVSVVTTLIGGASIGTVLPEAKRSGARVFIKVGTCGALRSGIAPGDMIVSTGALRFDGASDCWAPPEMPAVADPRIVKVLHDACHRLKLTHHLGGGATTACFNEGQGRPDDTGHVPPWMRERHERIMAAGTHYYSMEDSALFIWCATHGQHPSGAIHAVVANRADGTFEVKGEEDAARAALLALHRWRYTGQQDG